MKLNKKQKRTATIASMAALLAVVLGMGGQTFAKYITTQNVADQATVAKWGVVITNKADTAFSNTYGSSVVSATKEGTSTEFRDVVAPGTNGSFTLEINGTPEVTAKVEISLSIKDVFLKSKSLPEVKYYPIVWTYGSQTYNGENAASDLASAIATDTTYTPGTPIETNITIGWAWAFENKGEEANKHIVDEYDTILGDIAAGKGNYNNTTDYTSNITLDVVLNAKVSQVD